MDSIFGPTYLDQVVRESLLAKIFEVKKSFRDHFSMWQNSDSQRIDASYLFIMERPSEPWLQNQIDEESELFNDIYQVSNMKIYNATSGRFKLTFQSVTLNMSRLTQMRLKPIRMLQTRSSPILVCSSNR